MNKFVSLIALPTEGLSLFRRALGLLCLIDALLRLPTAAFLLSDEGVLPRHHYYDFFQDSYAWSALLISGQVGFIWLILATIVILGLLQVAGRDRRWTRAILWLLVLSVQNRNPGIIDASDDLLRLMLLWDIFLPDTESDKIEDTISAVTIGWQFQLSLALFFSALSFSGGSLGLSAQWGGGQTSADFAQLSLLLQFGYLAALAAVWVNPIRLPALVLTLLALLCQAYFLHPAFPLTVTVGLLSLFRQPKRERAPSTTNHPSWWWAPVGITCLVCLSLNTLDSSKAGRPAFLLGQLSGLSQNWKTTYPAANAQLVEIVAQQNQQVVWAVSSESGRRERLLAQQVGVEQTWSDYLAKAIATQNNVDKEQLTIWMKVENLRPDFGLSSAERHLLSERPVGTFTKGQLTP